MTFNFEGKTKMKLTGKSRKKLLFFAGIIMILLPVAYLTLKKPATAEASWWTGGGGEWQKRKHLTITNDSSDDLAANTTVAVSLDTKSLADTGRVRSDCNDIRIVYQPNSTTQTELDRYLSYPGGQTCETSGATKIYFSLQAALNDEASSEDYYVYFDNKEASSPSTQIDAFDIGSKNALLACPFDGTTTCINGDGTEDPTTESGAVRYGGGKGALAFDGSDDHIELPASASTFSAGESQTLEAWVYAFDSRKISPYGTTCIITAAGSNNRLCITEEIVIDYILPGTSPIRIGEMPQNQWTHLAAVYDGSYKYLFIDGSLYSTASESSSAVSPNYTSVGTDLWGGQSGNVTRQFYGKLDELRISNIARYRSNFTPPTAPHVRDEYTMLLLHFDEIGDDPRHTGKIIDDSGNGYHGTIYGNWG